MARCKIDFREMHHSAPQKCSHGHNFWYKLKTLTVKNTALVEFFSLFQIKLEMKNAYSPAKENILDFLLRG